jgi:hypothetical protein
MFNVLRVQAALKNIYDHYVDISTVSIQVNDQEEAATSKRMAKRNKNIKNAGTGTEITEPSRQEESKTGQSGKENETKDIEEEENQDLAGKAAMMNLGSKL